MAKTHGMGWTTLSVDDGAASLTDIKNDVTNFQFSTPRAVQDITGADKSAMERQLLLADFSITLNGVFNVSASHAVLKTVPSTSVTRTVSLAVAAQTLSNECVFTDYALTRPAEGSLTWSAPGVLANGTAPAWS